MVTGLSPAQLLPALVREVGAFQLRKAWWFFQEQQHFLLQRRRLPSALTDFTERGPPMSLPCCSVAKWPQLGHGLPSASVWKMHQAQ